MKNVTYISAGAGSGKTYTLTTKLAELISKDRNDPEHVEPEQVILTTFTVKAANEFKEKAKAELYKIGKYDEASRLDSALMGTVHNVASTLIQKYWYTIGLSPKQGVMDDNAKATYINQSIANIPTDDDLQFFAKFRKAFNVVDGDSHPDHNFWKSHLKDIVEKSISFDITDYSTSIDESLNILKKLCNGTSIHIDQSQRITVLDALCTEVGQCTNKRSQNKKARVLKAIDSLLERSLYLDDIEWNSEFSKIVDDEPALPGDSVPIPILEDAKQKAKDLWCSQEVYDLQEQYIKNIFRLAKEWNEQYRQYKLNKRVVDFNDMEHYMYRLLQDKEVATEIGRTYTHLFVDEFQDCSPIQVKIFMALADVVKKSYWVGDTKQAIYGFRGSDTALTKAVADAITLKKGKDGCKADTLGKNWRSVPSLVNACNMTFVEVFKHIFGTETASQVTLKPAMELHPEKFEIKLEERAEKPLRYLKTVGKNMDAQIGEMAQYIKTIIERDHVKPSDIAVLGRTKEHLDVVQGALVQNGVAYDRETLLDTSSKACQLMLALTTLTVNPNDELAKAEIAYFTQDNMGLGAIIDSKLEYNNTPKDEQTLWLNDTIMVKRVNDLRPRVMCQGIGALMETLAVELDVKNIMERWETPIEASMNDVKTLITAALAYEQRSSELALPATPSGFATFLEENEIKLPANEDGVHILTYHKAKGLEWKYVFMLMDENLDPMKVLKRGIYGVNHYRAQIPSEGNLYPQMSIRLLPWIFGSLKSNVPDAISRQLFASSNYDQINRLIREESARLLYVGMTRAAEVLTLVPVYKGKEFNWFVQSGLETAGNIDGGDVLGIGVPFELISAEFLVDETVNVTQPVKTYHMLNYHSDQPSDAALRTVAPSGLDGKADNVSVVYRSEQYIKINSGKLHGRDYSEVGDCIHNVFAAIEHLDKAEVEQLIRTHEMDEVLPGADEVIQAWNNLQQYLKKEYGEPVSVYHERPFRSLQDDGTIVVGSIDYVYSTPDGAILIDFKSFPQVQAITDPTSDHYAGLYAGQLNAYADAIQAAGEKVIKRFIYYPVSGMLVEIC